MAKIILDMSGDSGIRMGITRSDNGKLKAMVAAINAPRNVNGYTIGWDDGSYHETDKGEPIQTAVLAKILEFGAMSQAGAGVPHINKSPSGTIPARPFFRSGNIKFTPLLKGKLANAARRSKSRTPHIVDLEVIANSHISHVRKALRSGKYTALSSRRIEKKGHSTPLIGETHALEIDLTFQIDRKVG